jgi:hypothetical protein
MQVLKPSWDVFQRLVAEAKAELLICAPWISSAGLSQVRPIPSLKRIELWARVADINTDAAGLLRLAKEFQLAGISTIIRDSPVLHAKIYLADRSKALLTSANLSEAGFSNNLEAAALVTEQHHITQVIELLNAMRPSTTVVSIPDLEYFVANERPAIEALSQLEPPSLPTPIWRRRTVPAPVRTASSKAVDLTDLIIWIESSLLAAEAELKQVDLTDWVGKEASVWVCPCYVAQGVSPYLIQLAAAYNLGHLRFGERLRPEQFTQMEGVVEALTASGRAVFRKKRSSVARFELTRFPDRGSQTVLRNNSQESYFLLKIEAA